MLFCVECGEKLIDGARFCGKCGAPVLEEPEVAASVADGPVVEPGMEEPVAAGPVEEPVAVASGAVPEGELVREPNKLGAGLFIASILLFISLPFVNWVAPLHEYIPEPKIDVTDGDEYFYEDFIYEEMMEGDRSRLVRQIIGFDVLAVEEVGPGVAHVLTDHGEFKLEVTRASLFNKELRWAIFDLETEELIGSSSNW